MTAVFDGSPGVPVGRDAGGGEATDVDPRMPVMDDAATAVGALTNPVAQVVAADFTHADLECDMVMKGGVTSGIVYPAAILRLAQRFKLRSIGGTSAGAIAAAMAAAAEFRRASDAAAPGQGYIEFKTRVMEWLGESGHLQSLFVPVRSLAWLFQAFLWIIGLSSAKRRPSTRGRLNRVVSTLVVWGLPLLALYGLIAALSGTGSGWFFQVAKVVTIAVLVVIGVLAVLLFLAVKVWLPASYFGLCTGGRADAATRAEPLTFWLSRQLDAIAGNTSGRPLTFGDLWLGKMRPPKQPQDPVLQKPDEPVVDLQMVTTSLTMGRPFMLPLGTEIFYFREAELRRFFPDEVVDWMVASSPAADPAQGEQAERHAYLLKTYGARPFPRAADLPVVFGTRMSLSFPILLSALRLWAIDWTRPYNDANRRAPLLEPVWFSDGGVSSNFPISLFDSPLPGRPTLGITLDAFPPPDPQPNAPAGTAPVRVLQAGASIPNTNQSNINGSWTRFSPGKKPANLPGFVGAIINAMQNWQDSLQSAAPGFRDRIAHVHLSSREGGLNLTMPPDVIATLVERGEEAGMLLIDHFAPPTPPNVRTTWHNHRRVRVRTTFDVAERYARTFREAWERPSTAAQMSYPEVVEDMKTGANGGYAWRSPAQHDEARRMADAEAAVAAMPPPLDPLGAGAPKPVSDLHARPRF